MKNFGTTPVCERRRQRQVLYIFLGSGGGKRSNADHKESLRETKTEVTVDDLWAGAATGSESSSDVDVTERVEGVCSLHSRVAGAVLGCFLRVLATVSGIILSIFSLTALANFAKDRDFFSLFASASSSDEGELEWTSCGGVLLRSISCSSLSSSGRELPSLCISREGSNK